MYCALSIARGLGGEVHAVHISYDTDGARAFKRRWGSVVGEAIALDTIISPYRALMPPLLKYLDAIDRDGPGRPIIVVLAEFVPRHWWEALLHNQTALLLKLRLFVRRNTAVLDVPYHLDDPEPLDLCLQALRQYGEDSSLMPMVYAEQLPAAPADERQIRG